MSDQTRRDWVLSIGQAAVALSVPETFYGAATLHTLPPGLYLPSKHHLSHALMSADRYHPIPPGCPTDYVSRSSRPFEPPVFSTAESPMLLRLVQIILGDFTDDAAVSHEVAQWLDLYVASAKGVHEAEMRLDPLHRALATAFYGSAHERRSAEMDPATICREGIRWILNEARAHYSKDFLSLSLEQQTAILHSISDEGEPRRASNPGTRFFTLLKVETIRGFYTSRAGLKELNFSGNAYYTRSPGCSVSEG